MHTESELKAMNTSAQLEELRAQVGWLVERQRKQEEMLAEFMPIAREVLATATTKLDAIEKRGWFDFARALGGVGERILDHYSADDVRALGEAIVSILDTVRALTQPEVLAIAGETGAVLANTEEAKPIGLVGMLRASHDKDVQKGMAVLMSLLKNVGRAAQAMVDKEQAQTDRKARLAAVLGPRRKRALGNERTIAGQLPAPSPNGGGARARAATAPAPPATTMIDGVAFKPDGHLADPSAWTRALAENIAALEGVPLDAQRWKLIDVARAEFEEKKVAANIRRLTQISGLSTKEIFTLFPKAPGRTIARIAGTPKPAGCI
jgi:tRNA 2-thiouridine synthesizing protein E